MTLRPEELTDNGYILIDKMDHAELIPFVKKFIGKKTSYASFYYLSIFFSLALLVFLFLKFYSQKDFKMSDGCLSCFIGFVITLALIPFHEFIHATAYKAQGAKQTSYDVNLKKFYFLAIADKFVANRQEFRIIALAPFIIITLALAIGSFLSPPLWSITFLTTLMIHTTFCSGDFALLSYFEFNRKREIVTYDDKENKISYFYAKDTGH